MNNQSLLIGNIKKSANKTKLVYEPFRVPLFSQNVVDMNIYKFTADFQYKKRTAERRIITFFISCCKGTPVIYMSLCVIIYLSNCIFSVASWRSYLMMERQLEEMQSADICPKL